MNNKILKSFLPIALIWTTVFSLGYFFQPPLGLDFIIMAIGLPVDHFWCQVAGYVLAASVLHGIYAVLFASLKIERHSLAFIALSSITLLLFSDQIDFSSWSEKQGLSQFLIYAVTGIGFVANFAEHIAYIVIKYKKERLDQAA